MSDIIIVTCTHPLWENARVTRDTYNGLGTPFERVPSDSQKIIVRRQVLQEKRRQLNNYLTDWADGGLDIRNRTFSKADRRRVFGRGFYDILFPNNQLGDTAIDAYWGNSPSLLGPLSEYGNRTKIYVILREHITLINNILELTAGLAEVPSDPDQSPEQSSDADVLRVVQTSAKSRTFNFVTISKVEVPLGTILQNVAFDLLEAKTAQFFDRSREYKTVLNFGNNEQYLVEAWREGQTSASIQLKLTTPLSSNVQLYDTAYIVREFANSVIDTIQIEPQPIIDDSRSLRPYNQNVTRQNATSNTLQKITISNIGVTNGFSGAITDGIVSYEDRVFSQWYTADFNSSELNIDFTNYNNFVTYGSATGRLQAFRNKLNKLELLLPSGTDAVQRAKALEVERIKRNFDPYEQFLYYSVSTAPYSASAYYVDADEEVEYNQLATWPKDESGNPLSANNTIANNWFVTQSKIAERFDEFNPNYLAKHLPSHIQEDVESSEFLTFITMFGHVMDNIKIYIDQFPNIYSSNPNPLEDLTMDQVYEVASSFGISLPNAYAIEKLTDYVTTSQNGMEGRVLVAETWKRFLHSAIYLSKAKGTKTAIDGVMNVYGINSPLVQLKESSYPSADNYVRSDELSYGLQFTDPSGSIQLPFISGSVSAKTIQLRFIPQDKVNSRTILSADSSWAVDVEPHPLALQNNYGKIKIVSGALRVPVASSEYFHLFGDDYTHIMLRQQSNDFTIIQTDGDQILYKEIATSSLSPLWNTTEFVYVGGSGSLQLNTFDGIVDEVHIWGETITDDLFIRQAYDPGAQYGGSYTSSLNNLYVHVAFAQPLHDITSSAVNQSLWPDAQSFSLPTIGFTTESYTRVLRPIKQFVPVVGAVAYSNNKVSVAPPPVFSATSRDANGVPVLQRTNSIKSIAEKQYSGGHDLISFALSPIDFVNQNIMRTMGQVNTNFLIGSPRKVRGNRYTEVDTLYSYYLRNYSSAINPNAYIQFVKNVIAGPSEQIEQMIPARSTLIDGVVIESNILDRARNNVLRAFRADGSGTKTFSDLVNYPYNQATSSLAGAYTFDATYKLYPDKDTVTIPESQRVIQKINPSDRVLNLYGNPLLATSSLISNNSGIAFVESEIEMTPSIFKTDDVYRYGIPQAINPSDSLAENLATSSLAGQYSSIAFLEGVLPYVPVTMPQTGYPRAPYLGVPADLIYPRQLEGEENTTIPFYDIPPSADLNEVGATTYFNLESGVYQFPSLISKTQKELYLARFVETKTSVIDQIYSPIILLPPDTVIAQPGRQTSILETDRYESGESVSGKLKLGKLFTVLGIDGPTGLKITLRRESDNALLYEGLLDGDSAVNPYLLMHVPEDTIDYTILNTTEEDILTELQFLYFVYDSALPVPRGYLPRHYRYKSKPTIATKKRNYLGCKLIYCENQCPPGIDESDTVADSTDDIPFWKPFEARFGQVGGANIVDTQASILGADVTFGGAGPLE